VEFLSKERVYGVMEEAPGSNLVVFRGCRCLISTPAYQMEVVIGHPAELEFLLSTEASCTPSKCYWSASASAIQPHVQHPFLSPRRPCLEMRPSSAALDAQVRPHKQSIDPPIVPSSGPNAFFLATESDLSRRSSHTSSPPHEGTRVRTLKETIEEASQQTRRSPARAVTAATTTVHRDGSRRRSTIRPRSIEELRYEAIRQQASPTTTTPLTSSLNPSLPASQAPSLSGSPKSFSSRSLPRSDDDYSSQAVESEDEGQADHEASWSASMQDSAPQFIMPSIRMPSRRPFTERGKQLGKFKVMVVGSKGMYRR